jgi:hypothetical protein
MNIYNNNKNLRAQFIGSEFHDLSTWPGMAQQNIHSQFTFEHTNIIIILVI